MRSTKPYPNPPSCAKITYPKGCGCDSRSEDQRFDGSELFRSGLPNPAEIAEKSGVPPVGSSAKKGTMQRTPDQLPDPWLFDSEALLRELDRCRELVLQIPIGDPQATHFGINNAIGAIWNLTQQLRFLLHLHREGQRAFGAKAEREIAAKAALDRDQIKRDKFRKSPHYLACVR
jgi:hypothetical protein